MKLFKMGCIILLAIIGTVFAVTFFAAIFFSFDSLSGRSNPAPAPVPARSAEARTIPAPPKAAAPDEDPFQKKYGISKFSVELASSAYAKSIVRDHLNLPDHHAFPWMSLDQRVFEFEKRDNSGRLIGEWIGVNLKNYVEKDGRRHRYSGTFHYDPAAKKWHCSSFRVDDTAVSAVLQ